MKIWILSFGSDTDYAHLSNQVCSNISKAYPDANIIIYTSSDLPESLKQFGSRFQRGYGYWIWKPYVVRKTLGMAAENDIVLYVDGRSGASGKRIAWLDDFMATEELDLVVQRLQHIERNWTTGDLFGLFGLDTEAEDAKSPQFAATFFALRVNDKTRRVVDHWFHVMVDNYDLCRDEPSGMKNHEDFVENRHDQSVFSLTVKRAITSGVRVSIISKAHIDNSLKPHFSPRPGQKISISRRIRTLVSKLAG